MVKHSFSVHNIQKGSKGDRLLLMSRIVGQLSYLSLQRDVDQLGEEGFIVVFWSSKGTDQFVKEVVVQTLGLGKEDGKGQLVKFIQFLNIDGSCVKVNLNLRNWSKQADDLEIINIVAFIEG